MKRIKDFEDYSINEKGEVFSHKWNKLNKLKPTVDKDGYMTVKLFSNNKYKTLKVHRLVASTFLSNEKNKPVVAHLNHNRSDNRVENLQWATIKENIQMSIEDDRFISIPRPTRQKIKGLYMTGRYSQAKLARIFGISQSRISVIINEERL